MCSFIVVLILCVFSVKAAYEGEFCDNNGATGTCTILRNCPSAMADIRQGKQPPICTFENFEPIVCCVSTSPTTTTTRRPALTTSKRPAATSTTEYVPQEYSYEDITDRRSGACKPLPPSLTAPKTGQKAWDKCVEYQETLVFPCEKSVALAMSNELNRVSRCHHNADELIVGGTNAAKDEFPHMVLLGYGDDVATAKWQCAGSLISDRFVLTAGHCIANIEREPVSFVQVGALRRSDGNSNNRYHVRTIHSYSGYTPPAKYNDIALLELDTIVPLNEHTVPACVHTGEVVDDGRASATGWGDTKHMGTSSDIMQKVVLTKFNTSECAQAYRPNRLLERGFDSNTQICYGDRDMSKDTCQGDSGGPIQIKSKRLACMYTVVGVTSYGKACGNIGVPGIYTRVAHYLPWIESVVWP